MKSLNLREVSYSYSEQHTARKVKLINKYGNTQTLSESCQKCNRANLRKLFLLISQTALSIPDIFSTNLMLFCTAL